MNEPVCKRELAYRKIANWIDLRAASNDAFSFCEELKAYGKIIPNNYNVFPVSFFVYPNYDIDDVYEYIKSKYPEGEIK